ncbi:MAG: ThuA domain-containing protein [Thermomicrobiales bacterium]|nr:ThuA domain-containing protein [Thermomicrobiales bacterium]
MSDNQKQALVLRGGWDIHDPKNTSRRFAERLKTHGYAVNCTNNLAELDDAGALAKNDLIVICITMGEITDTQEQNLLAAVRAGTGLGGWHGGMGDSFRTRTDYQYAVGGQWVKHPGDRLDYTVQIVEEHEITAGVQDFAMCSEQYYMHVDPAIEVLATTTFTGEHDAWIDGVVMPVAWTKCYGAGKVFYCSIGHSDADFEQADAARLVEQGLIWATR